MARNVFYPSKVDAGTSVRIDTASGSTSPASITPLGTGTVVLGSRLRADNGGVLPPFYGPDNVTRVYVKTLDASGSVVGTASLSTVVTSPLQSVIDGSSAGEAVRLPAGTYDLTSPLVLRGGRTYLAHGVVVRPAVGANLDALVTNDAFVSATSTTFDTGVVLEGITVKGQRSTQTGGLGTGILLAVGRSKVLRCRVENTRGDGIVLTDVNSAGTLLNNSVTGVENTVADCTVLDAAGVGIWVHQSGLNQLTDGRMVGNDTGFTWHDGIRVDASGGWLISGNHPYACGLSGIVTRFSYATRVAENYIEGIGALDTATDTAVGPAAPTYSAGTAYRYGQVVTYSNQIYISKSDANTGNTPDPLGTAAWRPYISGGNSVAGILSLAMSTGRPLRLTGNQISLGHSGSYGLQSGWQYRGILCQGPESGAVKATVQLVANDVANEYQSAGANTTGYRLASGVGGLRVVGERDNAARGSWATSRNADAAVGPSVVAGANLGSSGTSVSVAGSDIVGSVTMTTGTAGVGAGILATASYSASFPTAPRVQLTAKDAASAALGLYVNESTSGFSIRCANAPATGVTLTVNYQIEP